MRQKAFAMAASILVLMALTPAGAGTLLIANKSDDTVDLFDLDSGRSLATLPTGHAPHEVAVSPDGALAAVSNYGGRDEPGFSLTIIDVGNAEVLRTIELGRHRRPHGMSWFSNQQIAVTTEESQYLLFVDPHAGRILRAVATESEISHMVAVSPNSRRAFVANIGSGTVSVIDTKQGRKLKDIATGDGAEGIAVTPDGKEVWVGNRGADTLSIIDTSSLEVKATLPCPGFPIRVAMTIDGARALVSCARTGEVALFDVKERKELKRATLDLDTVPEATSRLFGDRFGKSPVPVGLVISPHLDRAWVAATQSDVVVVIDPATLEVRDLIASGSEPDGMAYTDVRVETGSEPE